MNQYDVIVIGASVGGCSTAILYAQRGLRVALVEKNRQIDAYKKTCTHHIQPHALPILGKVGILDQLKAAGGQAGAGRVWTRYGWFGSDEQEDGQGLNVRRRVLDPALRRKAAMTPNVDLMLGSSLHDLVVENGRFSGAIIRSGRETKTLVAKLVVGADGRYSRTATLANLPTRREENNRFVYFTYFRDLDVAAGRSWYLDPDVVYAMPNDDGLTLVATMIHKEKLAEFKQDIEGNYHKLLAQLPDAPDFAKAEQASKVLGMIDMPNIARPPAVSGLALVGDAVLASDPVWGNGMAWALNAASWLVAETAVSLQVGTAAEIDHTLDAYADKHQGTLLPRFERDVDFASGRQLNAIERLMYAASVKDRYYEQFTGPMFRTWDKRNQLPNVNVIFNALRVVTGTDSLRDWHIVFRDWQLSQA
ncbi:MAG: NAD(P)/FAD-dependent oxidoreductase [Chloroflexota bacterium]